MININKIIEEYLKEQSDPPVGPGTDVVSWRAWTFGDPDSAGEGGMWSNDGGDTWHEDLPDDGPDDDTDTDTDTNTPVISFEDRVSAIRAYNNMDYKAPDVPPETGGEITWGGVYGFVDHYLGIRDKLPTWGFPEVSIQGKIDVVVDPGDDGETGTDDDGPYTHIWSDPNVFLPGLGYWRREGGFGPPKLP